MTCTEERLSDYLHGEAARVHVREMYEPVESGMTTISLAHRRHNRRWAPPALLLTAASLAVIVGLAINSAPEGRQPTIQPVASMPSATVAASIEPAFSERLPDGGSFQGLTPACRSMGDDAFECVTPDYPTPSIDITGSVYAVVNETSRVSGGCRSVNAPGTTWTCFIGARAVQEGLIIDSYLGAWAPRGDTGG